MANENQGRPGGKEGKGAPKRPYRRDPAQKRARSIQKRADEEFYDQEFDEFDYDRSVKVANRGCLVAFLAVAVAAAIVLFMLYLSLTNELNGKNATVEGTITVTVPSGAGGQIIGGILKEEGLIGNDTIFRFYARFNGTGGSFRAGEFELKGGMSYDDMLEVLTADPVDTSEVITVTFVDGRTVWQFGEALEELNICTAKEFVEAANKIEDFEDIAFFEHLNYDADTYLKAEGYLAPETFDIYKNESPQSIARRLYEHFNKVLNTMEFKTSDGNLSFYEQVQRQAAKMPEGYSFGLKEAIALASMVEEEASIPDENQPMVAGVFWNRLTKDISGTGLGDRTLGSDVTVYYVRETIARHSYDGNEDAVDQKWNYAYLCLDTPESRTGLPAGPLSNPSVSAIKAALQPADHNYFYFVTDAYGTYYYATTYNEHQRNIATAEQMNEQKKLEDGGEVVGDETGE